MKKLMSILTAFAFLFALTACPAADDTAADDAAGTEEAAGGDEGAADEGAES